MLFVSIDSATKKFGVAIYDSVTNITESYARTYEGKDREQYRLFKICDMIRETIGTRAPDYVFLEENLFLNSPKTASELAQLQGALKLYFYMIFKAPVIPINVATWKAYYGIKSFRAPRGPKLDGEAKKQADAEKNRLKKEHQRKNKEYAISLAKQKWQLKKDPTDDEAESLLILDYGRTQVLEDAFKEYMDT